MATSNRPSPVEPPDRYVVAMLNSVEALLDTQLEDGCFRSAPAYVPFHPADQKVIYGMAYLWSLKHPLNPRRGDARLLDSALRVGDFLARSLDDEGRVHYNSAGYEVHSVNQWMTHAWLEACALLGRELGDGRAAAWRAKLAAAAQTVCEEIREWNRQAKFHTRSFGTSPNHAALYAAFVYRAGVLFDRRDWRDEVDAFMTKFVELQDVDGAWPEYDGPVTTYAFMTLCGVALYAEYSGRAALQPRIERTVAWFARIFHPDGSPMRSLDGRQQSHKGVSPFGHFALSLTPEGRALAEFVTRAWTERPLSTWEFTHAAENHRYWHAGPVGRLPLDEPAYVYRMKQTAGTRKEGPWTFALQGIITPEYPGTPWALDRQTLFELHHATAGVVLDGSNCKERRDAATFAASGDPLDALPVETWLDAKVSHLRAAYRSFRAELRVEPVSDDTFVIRASASDFRDGGAVFFRLQPAAQFGTEITVSCDVAQPPSAEVPSDVAQPLAPTKERPSAEVPSDVAQPLAPTKERPSAEAASSSQAGAPVLHNPQAGAPVLLGDERFSVEGVRRLSWGKFTLDFDIPARIWWPMEGYNSYSADHRYADLHASRLIAEVALTPAAPACTVTARVG